MSAVIRVVEHSATALQTAVELELKTQHRAMRYMKLQAPEVDQVEDAAPLGMQVIFINRYFYPDVSATSQILFDLARRLVKQGVAVTVVCSRQRYDNPLAALPATETVEGIQVYRVRTTSFGRDNLLGRGVDYLSFYVTAVNKLLAIVQRGDVLVAKTDPPLISLAVAMVAKRRGAKLVNWLQDLFPEVASHLGASMPRWLNRGLVKLRDRSLNVASANVVIGMRMKEHLLQGGVAAASIHVVENWADGDFVEPKPVSASALRVALGLQHKFVVGYSGNLGRAHEFETILNAALALRNEVDVVFLMIGGGARMQQLKQAAAQCHLTNFIFKGYQPRELLADSMAAADVHLISLLPQLEGLIVPSKFYGILAAGRPSIVIGDTDGELARIVKREKCGEAVAVFDWDALISAIWHMKLDAEYRQQLGTRARTLFLERFTADRGADKWRQILMHMQVQSASLKPLAVA